MYFVRDSEEARKILNVKVYDELYRCSDCKENSIQRITSKLYYCECCCNVFIGVTDAKLKKLLESGNVEEIP